MDESRLVFLHLYLKFISNINIYQYEKKNNNNNKLCTKNTLIVYIAQNTVCDY